MLKNFLFLCFPLFFYAQQDRKVFYHVENDSMISYVDQNNQYIIKPFLAPDYKIDREIDKKEIDGNYFFITPRGKKEYAVDKNGEFLFYPYYYDNGPDDLQEGLFRITDKNNKVGFANAKGEIIIKPKYDFASSFTMGFTSYCNGCYFDRSKDSEHPPLVNISMHYIDIKGNPIIPMAKSNNPKDYRLENDTYIPYQLGKYTSFENKLIAKVKSYQKLIIEHNQLYKTENLDYEILQKPTKEFPYYHVKVYVNYPQQYFNTDNDNSEGTNFYINKNGSIFVKDWKLVNNEYVNTFININEWIKP